MSRLRLLSGLILAGALTGLFAVAATGQGTTDDYKRAGALRPKYEAAAVGMAEPGNWIGKTTRLWYRRSVKGGYEFVLADAATRERRAAFDHERLAQTLNKATGRKYTPVTLPFNTIAFVDDEKALEVRFEGGTWKCGLSDYACSRTDLVGVFERRQPPPRCSPPSPEDRPRPSPDKKLEAFILNYNLAVRDLATKTTTRLSMDGSEGNCYDLGSIAWSPDSKKLATYRVRPGYRRLVHYVESSPEDQLQPKSSSRFYAKPGDLLDLEQPVVFQLDGAEANRRRPRALPEPLRHVPPGVAQGWVGRDVRVQPARPPGLPRDRGGRADGHGTRGDLGGAEDLLLLHRGIVPAPARSTATTSPTARGRVDVGARRVEPPLPLRWRHRDGEAPDHQGRVGRARAS